MKTATKTAIKKTAAAKKPAKQAALIAAPKTAKDKMKKAAKEPASTPAQRGAVTRAKNKKAREQKSSSDYSRLANALMDTRSKQALRDAVNESTFIKLEDEPVRSRAVTYWTDESVMASLKKLNDADLLVKLVKNVPAKKLPNTIASVILFMDMCVNDFFERHWVISTHSHLMYIRYAPLLVLGVEVGVIVDVKNGTCFAYHRPKNANSIFILGADQKDNRHARTAIKNAWRCAKTEIRNNAKSIALIVDAFGD